MFGEWMEEGKTNIWQAMTDKQGETIYRLKMSINTPLNGGSTIIVDKEDIETVLNMLKEKDKQIAKYEKIYKEYDCYRWVKELEKKDKQIDLMAEFLAGKDLGHYKRQDGGEILGRYRLYDKNEWKQYFKNKLNSSEQN